MNIIKMNNSVYSRNNLSKIKDGAYIINLDEYESIGTQWIALYMNDKSVNYLDSLGVWHMWPVAGKRTIHFYVSNRVSMFPT